MPAETPEAREFNDVSSCLEAFAATLEAPIFNDQLMLTSAITLSVSLNSLATALRCFAQARIEDVNQSNAIADGFSTRIAETTLPSHAGKKYVQSPKGLQSDAAYFKALVEFSDNLKRLSTPLLENPTKSVFRATQQQASEACTNVDLEKDRRLFDLSFTQPIKQFVATIDFRDNRDKTSLRSTSLTRLADILPRNSISMLENVKEGPLTDQIPRLIQLMRERED